MGRLYILILSLLALLKQAGITDLQDQREYRNEEEYVTALVEAFGRTEQNLTPTEIAVFIDGAVQSVRDGIFNVCPLNYVDLHGINVRSVTLSNENCQPIDDVTKDRLITYLERVQSFIQPAKQTVFGFAQTASVAIRETGYTLKDALWAALLSGPGGLGFLIYLFRFARSLYEYIIQYFLPAHEDVTTELVKKNYSKLWQTSIRKIIIKQIVVKAFKNAKIDNENNIEMLREYIEKNKNVGSTGTEGGTDVGTEVGTKVGTEVGTEVGSTRSNRTLHESDEDKSKSRHKSRSRSRGGKPSKKTKKNRRTKKRKSRY